MVDGILTWLRESFYHPWALLLMPVGALPLWRWYRARSRTAIAYSSVELLSVMPTTWAVRARIVLPLLRTLAILLLVLCVARPRKGNELSRVTTEGIAIELVVDRSGSMRAMDFQGDNGRVNRLDAVKTVATEFITGGGKLGGRPDDMIGLIVFAGFADAQCPLTLDHAYLAEVISKVEPAANRTEDGTAIGDALALGVEHLRTLDESRRTTKQQAIKSRVMILLTDGVNTAGDIEPAQAAEMAAAFGIKVYTIGAGTRGFAPMPGQDIFGNTVMQNVPVQIDEDTLTRIAEMTGGRYFRATDTDSLVEIYGQIDKLEKTRTEEKRYMQYKEPAIERVKIAGITLPPLLLVALCLIAIELLLAHTRLRKLP